MELKELLWTTIWLLFILVLCVLFDSALPLLLLFIWLLGL